MTKKKSPAWYSGLSLGIVLLITEAIYISIDLKRNLNQKNN